MTATSTPKDNMKIRKMCDMRPDSITIRRSPVTSNHMYYRVQRPPSVNGFSPIDDSDNITTLSLICRLVLDSYVSDVMSQRTPKVVMIFAQSYAELNAINRYLCLKLEHHLGGKSKPWAINHSEIGVWRKKELFEKITSGEISLIITTSVMLCGIDLSRVDIVVIIRPFGHLSSFMQAGGRGGRNQLNGMKRLVAVYLLFNNTDIRENAKFITKPVKVFFKENMCSCEMFHRFFCPESKNSFHVVKEWCCDKCTDM